MTETPPPPPNGGVKPPGATEVTLKGLAPGTTSIFSEPIHSVVFQGARIYQDGPTLLGNVVLAVDGNGQPTIKDLIIKRSGALASGITAVWSPAAGVRARILGWALALDPATTTAAGSVVTLQDATTDLDTMMYLTVAAGYQPRAGQVYGGGGYRSAVPGNAINVKLSAATTGGTGVYAVIWGYEE